MIMDAEVTLQIYVDAIISDGLLILITYALHFMNGSTNIFS